MARPVVGGHFAPLALGTACGGKAIEGLGFLEEHDQGEVDVRAALAADVLPADGASTEMKTGWEWGEL